MWILETKDLSSLFFNTGLENYGLNVSDTNNNNQQNKTINTKHQYTIDSQLLLLGFCRGYSWNDFLQNGRNMKPKVPRTSSRLNIAFSYDHVV